MRKRYLLFIALSLMNTDIFAQANLFQKGTIAESRKNLTHARTYFLAAINHKLSLDEYAYISNFLLANKYFADVSKPLHIAERYYKHKVQPLYLNHVEAALALHALDSADYYLQQYHKIFAYNVKSTLLERSLNFLRSYNYSDTLSPTLLSDKINTSQNETYPSIDQDDSMMIFTRENKEGEMDFYYSKLDTCNEWIYAYDLGSPPNTIKHEQSHFVSADGRYLFFTRCGNIPTNHVALGQCDIYFAYKLNQKWVEDIPFGATINTHAFEGMPTLSADQKILYFVSDRPGGYGGKDIWYSVYEHGKWQVPQNLGPEINTPFDEISPFIAPDGNTLYFSSNGHPSFGGFDLYKYNLSQKKVINLGEGYNSPFDDISPVVDHKQEQIYFSSNRLGGYGGYDIYSMPVTARATHEKTTFWKGSVVDSVSAQRLAYAYIEIYNEYGDLIAQYQSNSGDGSFIIPLVNNKKYKVLAFRSGFQDVSYDITLENDMVNWNYDIAMVPDGYIEPIKELFHTQVIALAPINFEKNFRKLTPPQIEQLSAYLAQFDEKSIKQITINSYTDNSGTPEINMSYASERATSAHQVIENIISSEKIVHRIWGDANPIVPNDSDENRYINRRLEIIVEVFRPEE